MNQTLLPHLTCTVQPQEDTEVRTNEVGGEEAEHKKGFPTSSRVGGGTCHSLSPKLRCSTKAKDEKMSS